MQNKPKVYIYECDGMSHAHPGYLFSNHVPPTPVFFSYIVNLTLRSRSGILTPQYIPENPAPMMITLIGRKFSMGASIPGCARLGTVSADDMVAISFGVF